MSVELTAKQSEWLEHVRRASEQGLALRAYAAQYGLSMAALSKAKQTLMNCGAWPRTTQRTGMKRPSTVLGQAEQARNIDNILQCLSQN